MDPMDINQTQNSPYMNMQQPLPNSTAVLVLGIISIVGSLCYGVPGLVCGIIALVLSGKGRKAYSETPERYQLASYNNLNAGRICAIIGTILSVLAIIGFVIYFVWFFSMMHEMGGFPMRRRY